MSSFLSCTLCLYAMVKYPVTEYICSDRGMQPDPHGSQWPEWSLCQDQVDTRHRGQPQEEDQDHQGVSQPSVEWNSQNVSWDFNKSWAQWCKAKAQWTLLNFLLHIHSPLLPSFLFLSKCWLNRLQNFKKEIKCLPDRNLKDFKFCNFKPKALRKVFSFISYQIKCLLVGGVQDLCLLCLQHLMSGTMMVTIMAALTANNAMHNMSG